MQRCLHYILEKFVNNFRVCYEYAGLVKYLHNNDLSLCR